jgi:hypothetical protein
MIFLYDGNYNGLNIACAHLSITAADMPIAVKRFYSAARFIQL